MDYEDYCVRTFAVKASEWEPYRALSFEEAAVMYANDEKLFDGHCVEVMRVSRELPYGYPKRFKVVRPSLSVIQET